MNGRKLDVLIEDETTVKCVTVWADSGMGALISLVPGVKSVYADNTKYSVYLDARYDAQIVTDAIHTALLEHTSTPAPLTRAESEAAAQMADE